MDVDLNGAASGGLVSAAFLWLSKLFVSKTLSDIAASIARTEHRIDEATRRLDDLGREVAFIKGRMPKRSGDSTYDNL